MTETNALEPMEGAVVKTTAGSLMEYQIFDEMTPEEIKQVEAIKNSIDIADTNAVLEYGVGAGHDISQFSDVILQNTIVKDGGYAGEELNELLSKIEEININSLSTKRSGFFSNFRRKVFKFIRRYEKLSTQIDRIVTELETARDLLLRDVELLDRYFDKNKDNIQQLDLYIAAGELLLKELNETTLPKMEADARLSDDPLKTQEVSDFKGLINRFEKRVYDMKLTRHIGIQAMPQIRLIQKGDQELVEKIQTSILHAIPLWKNQVVIAITLFRQRKAVKIQKEVTDTTNELLLKNQEMLKEGTIMVAKESERGIVDMETLRKVNESLIETITETIRIQEEGKIARANAEKELKVLENDLKEKLLSAKRAG